MKTKSMCLLVFVLVLAALTLSACGGASKFPSGKFVRVDNPDAGMIFNKDGTWSAYNGIYTLAKGTYSVKGDLFIEDSNNSNGACPTPMQFKYTIDGDKLTFNYVDDPAKDPCAGRRDGFDNVTYERSK
jgi:hypothetical protein